MSDTLHTPSILKIDSQIDLVEMKNKSLLQKILYQLGLSNENILHFIDERYLVNVRFVMMLLWINNIIY